MNDRTRPDAAHPAHPPAYPPAHPPVHGPASVVGVGVGLLLAAVAYVAALPATWAFVVLPPLVGLLLVVRRGRPRQLGIGLVASGLALPLLVSVPFALIALLG